MLFDREVEESEHIYADVRNWLKRSKTRGNSSQVDLQNFTS